MMLPPSGSTVVRARWLAELAYALDEAKRLALHLSSDTTDADDIAGLLLQIGKLRAEVEVLRRGNPIKTGKDDPIWAYLANWPGIPG